MGKRGVTGEMDLAGWFAIYVSKKEGSITVAIRDIKGCVAGTYVVWAPHGNRFCMAHPLTTLKEWVLVETKADLVEYIKVNQLEGAKFT